MGVKEQSIFSEESSERLIPTEHILHHILRHGEQLPPYQRVQVLPATDNPPVFPSPYYLANIGRQEDPRLLELRFEKINPETGIALLMTNERYPRDLEIMAKEIRTRMDERGIAFDAVVAPESLGSKLSQEIARQVGPDTMTTTLQKGKMQQLEPQGDLFVGSPKPWIGHDHGVTVSSGTSHEGSKQKLFLDPKIAEVFRAQSSGVLVVDDARMTSGTVESSIRLLRSQDIPIAAVATVLNEAEATDTLRYEDEDIPYVWLTKLPLFRPTQQGMQPIPGTYDGLDKFYLEK